MALLHESAEFVVPQTPGGTTACSPPVVGVPKGVKRFRTAAPTCNSVTWPSRTRAMTCWLSSLKQRILVSPRLLRWYPVHSFLILRPSRRAAARMALRALASGCWSFNGLAFLRAGMIACAPRCCSQIKMFATETGLAVASSTPAFDPKRTFELIRLP